MIQLLNYYNQEDINILFQAINQTIMPGMLFDNVNSTALYDYLKTLLKSKLTGQMNNYDIQSQIGLSKQNFTAFPNSDSGSLFEVVRNHAYRLLAILYAMPPPGRILVSYIVLWYARCGSQNFVLYSTRNKLHTKCIFTGATRSARRSIGANSRSFFFFFFFFLSICLKSIITPVLLNRFKSNNFWQIPLQPAPSYDTTTVQSE